MNLQNLCIAYCTEDLRPRAIGTWERLAPHYHGYPNYALYEATPRQIAEVSREYPELRIQR